MPELLRRFAVYRHIVELVHSVVRDEIGIHLVAAPCIGETVNAVASFNDESRLDAAAWARRIGSLVRQIEMFYPDHAGRERPIAISAERNFARKVRYAEPA